MEELIHGLQRLVWGPGMLVFFLGTGIRFTLDSKEARARRAAPLCKRDRPRVAA